MARPIHVAVLILSVFCFLSSLNGAQANNSHFYVEGQVYCDTCRAQCITTLSEKVPGATVKLECKAREGGNVIYTTEGVTDESGAYKITADGEFEDDVCEISLAKSPRDDCSEIASGGWAKQAARITLTSNAGMADMTRRPNPLFFMKKDPLPECEKVLKELNIVPPEN